MVSVTNVRRTAKAWSLPVAAGRRTIKSEGSEDATSRSELTTHILGSMNFELCSDEPLSDRGILCEDVKGEIGNCEVPSSNMRSTLPPANPGADAELCIWVIAHGQLVIEQNSGIAARFGPGSVLLCDLTQPLRGRWERARLAYVRPARRRLVEVLGRAPSPRARGVESIEHLGLAPFLRMQLGMFASHGVALAAAEREIVVGSIFETSEALLRTVLAPASSGRSGPGAERLNAVYRYIQRNLHRHDLSVDDIARGTSISRAQLYRLFASEDKSVHGTLREERLVKSLSYLSQPESGSLSIGAIAFACGFSDQAVFSKLFRQRFNMTPREARAAARDCLSTTSPTLDP